MEVAIFTSGGGFLPAAIAASFNTLDKKLKTSAQNLNVETMEV